MKEFSETFTIVAFIILIAFFYNQKQNHDYVLRMLAVKNGCVEQIHEKDEDLNE